jgi:hypothetical protein
MDASIAIRYSGPALEAGRMDVYQAATNMLAFSEFMVVAVKAIYGEQAEAKAEVSGFEHGSFITDLLVTVVGPATSIFTTHETTLKALWQGIRGAFDLWKHLRGKPPAKVESGGDGAVSITNCNGSTITVNHNVTKIVFNEKATAAAEKFVREGLSHPGYQRLDIDSYDSAEPEFVQIVSVDAADAPSFVSVAPETTLSDNVLRMTLILVAAVFQEGNKWRFSDGTSTFSATIVDKEFLAAVDLGERFGKGDVMDVDLRIVQTGAPGRLSSERTILTVHRHSGPFEQARLLE